MYDREDFKNNCKDLFDELDPWMQEFFGLTMLFTFIYDFKAQEKGIRAYKKDSSLKLISSFTNDLYDVINDGQTAKIEYAVKSLNTIEERSTALFIEWEKHNKLPNSNSAQKFKQELDLRRIRINHDCQIKFQDKVKNIFPNLKNQDLTVDEYDKLSLIDFNQITAAEDEEVVRTRFEKEYEESLKDKQRGQEMFIRSFMTYLFGVFNRKENLNNSVQILKDIIPDLSISSRFLIAYLMVVSNNELRNRILYYQSQYYAVPLMYPCQITYKNADQFIRVVPESKYNLLFDVLSLF